MEEYHCQVFSPKFRNASSDAPTLQNVTSQLMWSILSELSSELRAVVKLLVLNPDNKSALMFLMQRETVHILGYNTKCAE